MRNAENAEDAEKSRFSLPPRHASFLRVLSPSAFAHSSRSFPTGCNFSLSLDAPYAQSSSRVVSGVLSRACFTKAESLEPETKLTAEEPRADDRAGHEHQGLMGGGIFFLPRFQFAKLVQPGQAAFDEPARSAQATAMGRPTLG